MLGIHVSKSEIISDKKVDRELEDALKDDLDRLGLNAAQVYVSIPQRYVLSKLDYGKVKAAGNEIHMNVHSCYPMVGIWKIHENPKDPEFVKMINHFQKELEACEKIGAVNYVVHIGILEPSIIAKTMKILMPMVKKTNVCLLLEMIASKARDTTYETPEKLDKLVDLIYQTCGDDSSWFGLCVDTSHIWCAGQMIKTYEQLHDWLSRLKNKKMLKLFHLNGCQLDRGNGKDGHAIPFESTDKIWSDVDINKSGVVAVVEYAVKHDVPMILEVKQSNEKALIYSINTIKNFIKKYSQN